MIDRLKTVALLASFAALMAGVLTGLAWLYAWRGWFTAGGPALLVFGLLGAYVAASYVLVPPRSRG